MAFSLGRAKEVQRREESGIDVPLKNELGEVETYVNEAGERVPSFIRMAGVNSDRYRRKKAQQDARKFDRKTLTQGKWNNDAMELAVACAITWGGVEEEEGSGRYVPFSAFNVEQVFKAAPWVLNDCTEAMEDAAGFLNRSSNQPANTSGEPLSLLNVGTMDLVSESI